MDEHRKDRPNEPITNKPRKNNEQSKARTKGLKQGRTKKNEGEKEQRIVTYTSSAQKNAKKCNDYFEKIEL